MPTCPLLCLQDISAENALKFPELYRELQKRRHLSLKTFLIWTWKAIYQGGVIMLGAVFLFDRRLVHVVGITFTSLILTELLMVAVEVKRWHAIMVTCQVRRGATQSPRRRGRASGSDAGTRCPRGVRPAERRAPTPLPRAPLRLGRC